MRVTIATLIALGVLLVQAAFVAFLLDIGPIGIDRGTPPAWPLALAVNIALMLLFCSSHSIMARPAFKRMWTQVVPPAMERSVYLLVSGVTLALVCLWWQPMPHLLWEVEHAAARVALFTAFAAGAALLFWAILTLDALSFHGLRQAADPQAAEPGFAVRGPYRFVRHPIQTGLLVMLWATPQMSVGHLLLSVSFSAYSVLATLYLEEPDLLRAIGERYRAYCERVPALLPWRRPD